MVRQKLWNAKKRVLQSRNKSKHQDSSQNNKDLKNASKTFKRTLIDARKKYTTDLHQNLRNLKTSNPKTYWDILNKACNKSNRQDHVTIKSLVEHFQELNSPSNTTSYNDHDNNGPEYDSTPLNDLFTEQEVRKQISKLKNCKSSGIDVILNEFLKNSPTSMVTLLVKFFNLILTTGLTPTEWSIGIMPPLNKKLFPVDRPGGIILQLYPATFFFFF